MSKCQKVNAVNSCGFVCKPKDRTTVIICRYVDWQGNGSCMNWLVCYFIEPSIVKLNELSVIRGSTNMTMIIFPLRGLFSIRMSSKMLYLQTVIFAMFFLFRPTYSMFQTNGRLSLCLHGYLFKVPSPT